MRRHFDAQFKMKVTRNENVLQSPVHRGVRLWESLQLDVQLIHRKDTFKNRVLLFCKCMCIDGYSCK